MPAFRFKLCDPLFQAVNHPCKLRHGLGKLAYCRLPLRPITNFGQLRFGYLSVGPIHAAIKAKFLPPVTGYWLYLVTCQAEPDCPPANRLASAPPR